ncbi:MAG: hypothetical protein PHF57_14100, partial [Methanoregula sp.]|nr:hypothetical protein [Methanoregula sp.]
MGSQPPAPSVAERRSTKIPSPAETPKPAPVMPKQGTIPPGDTPIPPVPLRQDSPRQKKAVIPDPAVPDEEPHFEPAHEKPPKKSRFSRAPDERPPDILSPPLKPSRSKMPLFAGAIVGVIVILLVLVVIVLPIISGSSGTTPAPTVPADTVIPETTATPATPSATHIATLVATKTQTPTTTPTPYSLVPGPTDTLPENQVLWFQVDKDSVSAAVTVIVTGPSRNVVKDVEVILTGSDGKQQTGHIKPSEKMDEITLLGTKGTDRVEVTVLFYSGETYKVIDKLLPFRSHG